MEAKVRLTDIATLIKVGHDESERRLADLRADFDQKHKENVDPAVIAEMNAEGSYIHRMIVRAWRPSFTVVPV